MRKERWNKLLAVVVTIMLVVMVLPATTLESEAETVLFDGGNGTEGNPYLVSTKIQLDNIRYDLSAHYKLTNNIVFSKDDFKKSGDFYNGGNGWIPIGGEYAFDGVFDGNGYTIKYLMINTVGNSDVNLGLFSYNTGQIKNLGMIDGTITCSIYTGTDYAPSGSIAAYNEGIIDNCYNTCEVTTYSEGNGMVASGGIAGINYGRISDCANYGAIYSTDYSGGIAGINDSNFNEESAEWISGNINSCYNEGQIAASGIVNGSLAGGMAGMNYGKTTNSYNNGVIFSNTESDAMAYSGGITGYNLGGCIESCYNSNDVFSLNVAGGISGGNDETDESDGIIKNCYNTGATSAMSEDDTSIAGGITAYNISALSYCYNIGSVSASNHISSVAYPIDGTITSCYYLDTIYNMDEHEGIISRTSEELKRQSTFSGFDFRGTWTMAGENNYPYPELKSTLELGKIKAPKVQCANDAARGFPKLTWKHVAGAEKYEVWRATSKSGTYYKMYTTSGTTYTNTSAEAGKTYFYKVRGIGSNSKKGEYSVIYSRTCDCAAPIIEAGNSSSSGKVSLKWLSVKGATKYWIYRSTDGKNFKYYNSTTKTSYINSSTTIGTTYYYKIKAVTDVSSNATSTYSNTVSRMCVCAATTAKGGNNPSSGKITLSWQPVSGATKYWIYRSTDGKNYSYYRSTNNTYYTNNATTAGKTYYYRIKAVSSISNDTASYYSNTVSRTCDCAKPVVTANSVASAGNVKLSWKAVEGATKYWIYRSTDGKNYKYYDSTTKTSYTNKSTYSGNVYYYKVKATTNISDYAVSAYSNAVKIKVK